MAVSSLGFRSASSLPGNEVLKDSNSETPTSTDNKSPQGTPAISDQRARNGAAWQDRSWRQQPLPPKWTPRQLAADDPPQICHLPLAPAEGCRTIPERQGMSFPQLEPITREEMGSHNNLNKPYVYSMQCLSCMNILSAGTAWWL